VRLYEQGLIYRSERLVNWWSALNTAISDLEIEYEDISDPRKIKVPNHRYPAYSFGYLSEFAYKVKDSDEQIVVATTRLETMLGDTAVAVHPNDKRYSHLIGKELIHPFIPSRKIKIIADAELVDMSFGTGAVKITPGHDHNDFLCGQRHKLEQVNILNDNGSINSNGGKFEGMMRLDARFEVQKRLEEQGLFVGKKKHQMRIGKWAKTGDIIEPLIKPQWYLNWKSMAENAIKVVKKGEVKIIPKMYEKVWFDWLENIQDWWLSRQLWWGHRIPAYKNSLGKWIIARSDQEALEISKNKYGWENIIQDEDVLDTWFSSSLFPFYTLGWPEENHIDYQHFFPGDLLETGHDIIFFWVARMVMMSLTLTNKIPFKEVYLHPIVRDQDGK
jgi:valyl-tRNA synthetase